MRSQKPVKAQLLPSGRFRTQVVYGKDENGKNLTKSFTADTSWEAIKMAEDFLFYTVRSFKRPSVLSAFLHLSSAF